MEIIKNFRYRPEIDGLRAVAVLAVVLFHAGLGVPGGFVGVDVFFVISGFLITSLILKDLQAGKFTLANFWERRARRIIPAVVVVVLATLVAGWFLLLPSDYGALGKSTAWQAVFGANFYFWRHTGYFDKAADEQPLLHTWSLAVEEQFYFFFPLILIALFCIPLLRRRRFLLAVFLLGLFASFAVSVVGVHFRPKMAFYLLPFRGWELLCGAMVAVLPANSSARSGIVREGVVWLGLAAILVSCFHYTKSTSFPGVAALLPCMGTAAFIWASLPGGGLPFAARLLAWRPVVFIGLVSYSFYLWHWPIFAIGNYWARVFGSPPVGVRLTMIAVAFGLAVLSWKFVETPFRKRRVCARRPAMFGAAAIGITGLFMAGFFVSSTGGFPKRISPKARAYAAAVRDMGFRYEGSAEDVRENRLPIIGKKDPEAPISLLLWGDSHAMAAVPAFDQFLMERGLSGRVATRSSTPPVIGAPIRNRYGYKKKGIAWNKKVFRYIKSKKIHIVVLGCFWRGACWMYGREEGELLLLNTIEALKQIGVDVYVLWDVPMCKCDVPRFLVASEILGLSRERFKINAKKWNNEWGNCPAPPEKIRAAGGRILDPRPLLLDSTGRYYALEMEGIPLFRDRHHLTRAGALIVVLPALEGNLGRRLTSETSSCDQEEKENGHPNSACSSRSCWPDMIDK